MAVSSVTLSTTVKLVSPVLAMVERPQNWPFLSWEREVRPTDEEGGEPSYCGGAVPGDAQDCVGEASLQVGERHRVQALLLDHLPEVLQDLINVGVALRVAQDGLHISPCQGQTLAGLDQQTRNEN